MPVGPLNETHEPPRFYSVERPYVETYLIPSTWQEGGAGLFGSAGGFNYRVYVVGGLDATGFTAASGLRKGRQKVSEGKAEDLAFGGRLEYTGLPGFRLGTSAYQGDSAQNTKGIGRVPVTLLEADAAWAAPAAGTSGAST